MCNSLNANQSTEYQNKGYQDCMACLLLKIPKPSTQQLEKIFRAITAGSPSASLNQSHLHEKEWEWSVNLALLYLMQHSGFFFLCTDCIKNQKFPQTSSTAVSNFWTHSSWGAELVSLLMRIDEVDEVFLGFFANSGHLDDKKQPVQFPFDTW